MPINKSLDSIRAFIKAGLNAEMPADKLQEAESILKEIDNVETESKSVYDELTSCKEYIVKSVREGGSKTPPVEDSSGKREPRSMEEIARQIIGGN